MLTEIHRMRVLVAAATPFHVRPVDLVHTKNKHRTLSAARQTAAYLFRGYAMSYPEIGHELQYRDHTSAMSGVFRIKAALATNEPAWLAARAREALAIIVQGDDTNQWSWP